MSMQSAVDVVPDTSCIPPNLLWSDDLLEAQNH